jgi:histidine triad (HIT) family protein
MKAFLTRCSRTKLGGFVISLLFTNFSFALPVKRLRETETLMAIFHPNPSYKLHILIIPKLKYKSIFDIPPGENEFTSDLFSTIMSLANEFELEKKAYRLILNGGNYQEVDHLHFHLVSDDAL